MQMLNSFTVNPNPARRCDGCGVIVGGSNPLKAGIEVREGPLTGFFHSHQCFETKWKEVSPDEDIQF